MNAATKTFTENQDSKRHLLDLSWWYDLKKYFLGIKVFCFSRQKAETFSICLKLNFVKPHKISTHSAYSDNCYFHFFYQVFCLTSRLKLYRRRQQILDRLCSTYLHVQMMLFKRFLIVLSIKTFTENWVSKQSFFVLILTTA